MNDAFIDIHSHVLWGVDDGSQSIPETIELCDMACSTGTSALFLTPHLMYWDGAEALFDERNDKIQTLEEILAEEEIPLKIYKGFEILCDDEIFGIKYFKPYTLNDSRYILIEFDFFKTSTEDVLSWCSYLKSFGLVPIIAHPERYEFTLSDHSSMDILSEAGALFQVNSGSAAGMFGEEIQDFAIKMINSGFADFVGSDAHDLRVRNTDFSFCFNNYPDEVDVDLLNKAAQLNPRKILQDEQINVKRLSYFAEM